MTSTAAGGAPQGSKPDRTSGGAAASVSEPPSATRALRAPCSAATAVAASPGEPPAKPHPTHGSSTAQPWPQPGDERGDRPLEHPLQRRRRRRQPDPHRTGASGPPRGGPRRPRRRPRRAGWRGAPAPSPPRRAAPPAAAPPARTPRSGRRGASPRGRRAASRWSARAGRRGRRSPATRTCAPLGWSTVTVALASGSGWSRKVTVVMSPSVPSDPTKRRGRSKPATFFTTLPPPRAAIPSARTMETPMIRSRAVP